MKPQKRKEKEFILRTTLQGQKILKTTKRRIGVREDSPGYMELPTELI